MVGFAIRVNSSCRSNHLSLMLVLEHKKSTTYLTAPAVTYTCVTNLLPLEPNKEIKVQVQFELGVQKTTTLSDK